MDEIAHPDHTKVIPEPFKWKYKYKRAAIVKYKAPYIL